MVDSRWRYWVVLGAYYEQIIIMLALPNSSVPFAPVAHLKTLLAKGANGMAHRSLGSYCLIKFTLNVRLYTLWRSHMTGLGGSVLPTIQNFLRSWKDYRKILPYLPIVSCQKATGTYSKE